jgi:hypothetical protein
LNRCLRLRAAMISSIILVPALCGWSVADDSELNRRLNLADLAGYRAALAGNPAGDHSRTGDPPTRVAFKDLWKHEESFLGRSVTIHGRVSRVFRQGPIGSFPPLAEYWITSPAGDPFCVVFPQAESKERGDQALDLVVEAMAGGMAVRSIERHRPAAGSASITDLGQMVRFTGTFLKMVRYEASDGGRLAPLVVGSQLPEPFSTNAHADRSSAVESPETLSPGVNTRQKGAGSEIAYWTIGLLLGGLIAIILARRHLTAPLQTVARRNATSSVTPDSPLEFIDPHDLRMT